jgi:predicted Zn-dependent protease
MIDKTLINHLEMVPAASASVFRAALHRAYAALMAVGMQDRAKALEDSLDGPLAAALPFAKRVRDEARDVYTSQRTAAWQEASAATSDYYSALEQVLPK